LGGPGAFHTTHWSIVLAARNGGGSHAHAALNSLCRSYWPPIYAYVRRARFSADDAPDLTQAFFAHFLEHDFLQRLRHREGRFRSFLLVFLKRFLADARDKARAQKRGGGQQFISWEECAAEESRLPVLERLSAGHAFDRRWAMALLERAQARLREEFAAGGKAALFEALQPFQGGEESPPAYAAVAARLAMPVNTVKSLVRRLRQRYRQLLREEVSHTVAQPCEIDAEIRYLLAVITE
jgi:RNA polymerase sigma-70 factor (ECF subfamily)